MSCSICHDRGYIQVAFGKSGEMQMTHRHCPQCSTTEEELLMAKSQRPSTQRDHPILRFSRALKRSQGFRKSRLGSSWKWNCSCGHEGTAATEQEAIDQYVMHREEAAIPTGAWGPNMGHHQLREVLDTRDSVKHALPAMQGVPPLAAYMPPTGIMGFLHHG